MKVVAVWLDDDGYEAYRREYDDKSAMPAWMAEYITEFKRTGKRVFQVGDMIIEVFGK